MPADALLVSAVVASVFLVFAGALARASVQSPTAHNTASRPRKHHRFWARRQPSGSFKRIPSQRESQMQTASHEVDDARRSRALAAVHGDSVHLPVCVWQGIGCAVRVCVIRGSVGKLKQRIPALQSMERQGHWLGSSRRPISCNPLEVNIPSRSKEWKHRQSTAQPSSEMKIIIRDASFPLSSFRPICEFHLELTRIDGLGREV